MQNLLADVRYAARQFRLSPIFSLTAILTLALGIGGTTAIFSLIHTIMLRSLPVADPASLSELDSIAKRRDDSSDVGELKRLVTVLLQEIDDWPSTGLLIAATNHADLLDPAVWRRFEMRVEFPMPTEKSVHRAVETFLGKNRASSTWNDVLAVALRGLSFSDIERELMLARRSAVVHGRPLEDALSLMVERRVEPLPRRERGQIAMWLTEAGISQRQVHDLTGVSRDTIRKKTKSSGPDLVNEE